MYLDSQVAPNIQLDVNHEIHQKLLRSALKISQGTQLNTDFLIFDDTRSHLFKELLPYWAGFKYACSINPDGSLAFPLTKQEKLLRERLEEFMQMRKPSANDFKLPSLISPMIDRATPATMEKERARTSMNIVFSIATGIKYKDDRESMKQFSIPPPVVLPQTRSSSNSERRNSIRRNSTAVK